MNIRYIDLRSDTLTKPSTDMLRAMSSAPVGDDVYGEDPTVNLFQERMASLFGMEAGLFVPTGVMSNQLAIKAWTSPGDEVIVERESHIFNYETAAPSMMSAVQLCTVDASLGVLEPDTVRAAVRPTEYYYPVTSLVCIENTHNRFGGTLYPLETMGELHATTKALGIALHLDGARIWNAHIASGTSLRDYGCVVDSISICFSKGLGAPVGSMLLGPASMIARAHKYRKIFGGGMRQAGVLAAAAHFAVENNLSKLARDHERARGFAEAIMHSATFSVDLQRVQSNMVLLDFSESDIAAGVAQQRLEKHGVRTGMGMGECLRAVFHLDLTDEDVDEAIHVTTTILG